MITDIGLAPVNDRGMVEYSMDIFILKPFNLGAGNHRLLYDFNNRGQMRMGFLNDVVPTNYPTTAVDAGTGLIMELGYTVLSNGWDCGARGFDSMTISIPVASDGGDTITGPSYEYISFDDDNTLSSELASPAASTDKPLAKLTVRARLDDEPTTVPASGWDYTSTGGDAIRLLPEGTPFRQSFIYEFTYTAEDPVVSGIGLAAIRDFVSFLRNGGSDEDNPLAGDVECAFSYSISQPPRALNDFQALGCNEDEHGRRVFDGRLSHVGGGSGDQINFRFGQPGRTERDRQNHL